MKSVEALLGEINKHGWLITEVYQRDHDQWFATLRQRGEFSAIYAEGATMGEALGAAWEKAAGHKRMTNADWRMVATRAKDQQHKPKVARFIPGNK